MREAREIAESCTHVLATDAATTRYAWDWEPRPAACVECIAAALDAAEAERDALERKWLQCRQLLVLNTEAVGSLRAQAAALREENARLRAALEKIRLIP